MGSFGIYSIFILYLVHIIGKINTYAAGWWLLPRCSLALAFPSL
jgi:hypothetical protein